MDQIIGPKAKLSFYWQQTKTWAPISPTLGQTDGLPDPIGTQLGTFDTRSAGPVEFRLHLTPTLLLHLGGGYRNNNFFTPAVTEEGESAELQRGDPGGLKGAHR